LRTLQQIEAEEMQIVSLQEKSLLNEMKSRGLIEKSTVIGFVCPEKGHTHSIRKIDNVWVESEEEPEVYLALVLERVVRSNKRFIIVIGGRGSGKSVGVVDIRLIDARDNLNKTYFLREFQSSIKSSVKSLIKDESERLEFTEFEDMHNSVNCNDEEVFAFAGLSRNVDSIKSAHGFTCFSVEESQFITSDSLTALTPTVRQKPRKGLPEELEEVIDDHGVSMIFVANPGSTEDPFSKRFINPYQKELDGQGFYEDELHLIVVMNYMDNPWFHQSGLEIERKWDYEYRPRAMYDHIWLGAMNDSVEDALIMSEWFDACVDAHIKLGFEPRGAKVATHDPSDTGPDDKGYAMRHGVVVLDVEEKKDGDINEGGHWAANRAIDQGVDYYSWDCDGMGVGLAEQNSTDFHGKKTTLVMFKGSETPDHPKAIYQPALKAPIENQKTIGDSFLNKRAQYYYDLRDRCYRTWRAVVLNEMQDPETLISFSSEIKLLSKVRSELCRMPVKPNSSGLFALYTKEELKRKFKLPSPNLGDSVMMLMRYEEPDEDFSIEFTGWADA